MMILEVIASALCYILFNWQFFLCAESILQVKPLSKKQLIGTFLLNYSIFFLCSVLGIHLILNWIAFLVLLFAEQLILYRQPAGKCLLMALLATQFGLAANIFFRSLCAIILNVPLVFFDSNSRARSNMKAYPVILGFLAVGIIIRLVIRAKLLKRLTLILEQKNILRFLTGLLTAMYFYLCMNLFVYYIEENSLIIKLWSMKSAVFVIVGECLALILSIRMGEIALYREKNQESRRTLWEEKQREKELRTLAATDPLTSCENRRQARIRIQKALDANQEFCLCFMDLNGLKAVNDNWGHEMGDRYLLALVQALNEVKGREDVLFRYGGDEFLLLLFEVTVSEASELVSRAQKLLDAKSLTPDYPCAMSFSYGIVTSKDGMNMEELIQVSDSRMYKMKAEK